MLKQLFYTFWVLIAATGFVTADGQKDKRFEQALQIWLQDNDVDSLPILSDLAKAGHRDSQFFLGRLDSADLGPSNFRRALSPKENRQLFRNMEGSSAIGKTWMLSLAENDDPLATAIIASRIAEPDPNRVLELEKLGEREATHYAARLVALYGDAGQKKLLKDAGVLPDGLEPFFDFVDADADPLAHGIAALRFIMGSDGSSIDPKDPDVREMASFLGFGFQFGKDAHKTKYRKYVDTWLAAADYVRPIRGYCDENCPNAEKNCAFAMLGLSDGYYGAIRLDSPAETLLPQTTFLNSLRAQNMAARRAAFARTDLWEFVATEKEIENVSQCFAKTVGQMRKFQH